MKTLLLLAGLFGALATQTSTRAPTGYRFPVETDYSGDWKEFRAKLPTPFVVRADFNGDGLIDEAWLLPATSGQGWGLFAVLGSSNGTHRFIRLEQDRESAIQRFGLSLVEPGQYETACGKGYWDCKRDEPEVLELKSPAFELAMFESASSIFWWDRRSGRFRRTWISD
jgi:hypothetical protein